VQQRAVQQKFSERPIIANGDDKDIPLLATDFTTSDCAAAKTAKPQKYVVPIVATAYRDVEICAHSASEAIAKVEAQICDGTLGEDLMDWSSDEFAIIEDCVGTEDEQDTYFETLARMMSEQTSATTQTAHLKESVITYEQHTHKNRQMPQAQ
jgi:hypothetical protein